MLEDQHTQKLLDDYAKLVLVEYRQKILNSLILASIAVIIGISAINLFQWNNDPNAAYALRNILVDVATLAVLLILWQLNRMGKVESVAWILGVLVFTLFQETYAIENINQTFLIMALPILLAGFGIRPCATFVFLAFTLGWYSWNYYANGQAFHYDIFQVGTLIAISVGAYVIATILNKTIKDVTIAYDETIQGWAAALDMRDTETMGHSKRMVELTLKLASRLSVPQKELIHIRRGVLIHDIGKMAVPDSILHKSSSLTEEEWAIMRKHPEHAYTYLANVKYLRPALDIPYCHHEKWDGSGYPQGLQGEAIPLAARIFAIVDVWDALLSDRPYRRGWERETIIEYLRKESGKHFDPEIVPVFIEMIQEDE